MIEPLGSEDTRGENEALSRRNRFDRERDGSARIRFRFGPEELDNIEAAAARRGVPIIAWMHNVLAHLAEKSRDDLPWEPLAGRQALPRARVAELLRAGSCPSAILELMATEGTSAGRSRYVQDRLVDAIDNLIALGLIQSSTAYLSVPPDVRDQVEDIASSHGRVFAPGDRADLMSSASAQLTDVHRLDLIATLRYGPIERNIGDLYMTVRSFELVLSGLVKGMLVMRFGLVRARWWYEGVPESTRVALAAEGERQKVDDLWRLVTFGNFQSIIKANDQIFREGLRLGSSADVQRVADVRNAVMHPSKRIVFKQAEFQDVFEAFNRLRRWVDVAANGGVLDPAWMPSDQQLYLPPAAANAAALDHDEGKTRRDGISYSDLLYDEN